MNRWVKWSDDVTRFALCWFYSFGALMLLFQAAGIGDPACEVLASILGIVPALSLFVILGVVRSLAPPPFVDPGSERLPRPWSRPARPRPGFYNHDPFRSLPNMHILAMRATAPLPEPLIAAGNPEDKPKLLT